jgi:hypothetical protein
MNKPTAEQWKNMSKEERKAWTMSKADWTKKDHEEHAQTLAFLNKLKEKYNA